MSWFDRPEKERHRMFAVQAGDTKNTVSFKRMPPHGHWKISLGKGTLPTRLNGKYLRFEDAMRTFETYLTTRPNPGKITEELTVGV